MNVIPMFQHDCDECIYLGPHKGEADIKYDLYACVVGFKTVVARYSGKGEDYVSGLDAVNHSPELQEALDRARLIGVIK